MSEMETYVPEIPEVPEVPEIPEIFEIPEAADVPEILTETESITGGEFAENLIEAPEVPEIQDDVSDGFPSQSSAEAFGMGATFEGADGSVIGPEKAEIYYNPETIVEKEPGLGPKPSWDQPPTGSVGPSDTTPSVTDVPPIPPTDTPANSSGKSSTLTSDTTPEERAILDEMARIQAQDKADLRADLDKFPNRPKPPFYKSS